MSGAELYRQASLWCGGRVSDLCVHACVCAPLVYVVFVRCSSYNAETWGYGVMGPGSERDHGGIPSCANKQLLTDTLRKEWGFKGCEWEVDAMSV